MNWRRVLRIARWEIGSVAGEVDRKTVLILLAVLLALAPVTSNLARGLDHEEGLYRVGVSRDSPYHPVVSSSTTFTAEDPNEAALRRGDIDLLVTDGATAPDTEKGRAALRAFREAVQAYNDGSMAGEPNSYAAFPVRVDLIYVERRGVQEVVSPGVEPPPGPEQRERVSPGDSAGGPATGTSEDSGGEAGSYPALRRGLGGDQVGLSSPASIQPPFPFKSLVLAFLFVIPMNFVMQVYSSSIVGERIDRRGELLLVSPASRVEIVAGKTLPYVATVLLIAAATAALVGGGALTLAAVLPIALAFVSTSFVAGLLARSFKELTFVMVAVSVFVTTYLFVPAVFTDIHPVAAISPVTMVVHDLRGEAVPLGDYLFSTGPLYLVSAVLFALGTEIYREEDLFTQKPLPGKVMDAVQGQIRGRISMAKLSILFIPFVFATELLGISILFAMPLRLALPVLLVALAIIEEFAKSVHVYTALSRNVFDSSLKTALSLGGLSGLGFFAGEKLTLATTLVGLNVQVDLGRAAFQSLDSPLALLVLAPLVLHVSTACVSALGARAGRTRYAAALLAASAIHASYNFAVVGLIG